MGRNLSLDAAIQVLLTKHQKASATPRRASAVPSSSAAGVSKDKEVGHDRAQGGSWQDLRPFPCPLRAIRWTPALEKNSVITRLLVSLRHIKKLIAEGEN